jgi:hypothetical protein
MQPHVLKAAEEHSRASGAGGAVCVAWPATCLALHAVLVGGVSLGVGKVVIVVVVAEEDR